MIKVLESAMRLLARREHGARELSLKLRQKGFEAPEITEALDECQRLGLQSDSRFAESLCRCRKNQGYGPVKIINELRSKYLDNAVIESVLGQHEKDWLLQAEKLLQKKFKAVKPSTLKELQKQQRFMLYRGFPMDMVKQLFQSVC